VSEFIDVVFSIATMAVVLIGVPLIMAVAAKAMNWASREVDEDV
jgi:hypothetical protein